MKYRITEESGRFEGRAHLCKRQAVGHALDEPLRRAGGQGSHQLRAMARADALALAPDGVEIEPGDEVRILPLR